MIEQRHELALKFALGADKVGHSGRTLFDHLKGTHDLLLEWGALEHIRLAGLFHSIYGTIYFKHECLQPTLKNRELVAELNGQKAERLAYVFCVADRRDIRDLKQETDPFRYVVRNARDGGTIMLTPQELIDLLMIEQANLLEQRSNREQKAPDHNKIEGS